MKIKTKRIIACVTALAAFAVVIALLSRLTEPKYSRSSREGSLISEYYRAVDASERHDVIFIGDCEAYSSFVPPILWEEYGISSHVRGSPSQSMAQSYHIMCETLEYERPRAMVFSVYALCRADKQRETYNRMTLDGMRASIHKVRAVRDSIGRGECALSYFLPLLRFHSRWSELTFDDIKYIFKSPHVSHNGYLLRRETVPIDGEKQSVCSEGAIPQENFDILKKMTEVCKNASVELILVKSPTNSWRYPWYEEWSREIEAYAISHSVKYYDLTRRSGEIGIDMLCDSYDGGMHLNVLGAEKTTRYFGDILSGHIGRRTPSDEERRIWEKKLENYYNERNKDA